MHITNDLPVRLRTLGFADRVEVRFGNAFPIVLLVDRTALDSLIDVLTRGRSELVDHEAGSNDTQQPVKD
ncbi:hypothetical protein [Actinocrispum wychmicini]|uniref:hypothetical protein n=1 Tax=Actinocrispum wychmicini TaxID=1213861 RepID=UPI001044A537|nr:hypothetical protein [Actinocrispum wychmicini]